jgi:ParB family chromosome partitioning protein
MAEGRRGLGRGLSALLGDAEEAVVAPEGGGGPVAGTNEIPIELIRGNPGQPRIVFDEADLAELAASISLSGVLQPILVRPAGPPGHYEIVAGERRWRERSRPTTSRASFR